jgi:hypothetical protein
MGIHSINKKINIDKNTAILVSFPSVIVHVLCPVRDFKKSAEILTIMSGAFCIGGPLIE